MSLCRVCEQDGLLNVVQDQWKDGKKYGLPCNDCISIAQGIKNVIVFMHANKILAVILSSLSVHKTFATVCPLNHL